MRRFSQRRIQVRAMWIGTFFGDHLPSPLAAASFHCHNQRQSAKSADLNYSTDARCEQATARGRLAVFAQDQLVAEPQDSECLMAFRRKVLRNSLRTLRARCHYWVPRLSEGISPLERVMHFGTRPANSALSAQLKDGAICRERRALYFAPYTPLAP